MVPPLLSANPVVALMDPEPPADVAPIGPGHPMAGLVHLAEGCDVRPLALDAGPHRRPAAGDPDTGCARAAWRLTCCSR